MNTKKPIFERWWFCLLIVMLFILGVIELSKMQ
jgi:hypothetical protein